MSNYCEIRKQVRLRLSVGSIGLLSPILFLLVSSLVHG